MGAELYTEIGRRIAELRRTRERFMTQEELGRAVSLSRTSIANLERGRHRIQIHVLYEIARALGVDPRALLPISGSSDEKALPADFAKRLSKDERTAVADLLDTVGKANEA